MNPIITANYNISFADKALLFSYDFANIYKWEQCKILYGQETYFPVSIRSSQENTYIIETLIKINNNIQNNLVQNFKNITEKIEELICDSSYIPLAYKRSETNWNALPELLDRMRPLNQETLQQALEDKNQRFILAIGNKLITASQVYPMAAVSTLLINHYTNKKIPINTINNELTFNGFAIAVELIGKNFQVNKVTLQTQYRTLKEHNLLPNIAETLNQNTIKKLNTKKLINIFNKFKENNKQEDKLSLKEILNGKLNSNIAFFVAKGFYKVNPDCTLRRTKDGITLSTLEKQNIIHAFLSEGYLYLGVTNKCMSLPDLTLMESAFEEKNELLIGISIDYETSYTIQNIIKQFERENPHDIHIL